MSEKPNEFCYFEDLLPAELKQMVLDYLSVSDLLNLCLVNKSLNEFIGKSRDCMRKIWIKFYTFKLKDLESLTLSVRNYEKLKINKVKNDEHFRFLVDLQQTWTKLLIYNSEFKFIQRFVDFVESFSETIEELEISDIEVLNNEQQICSMKFPNLKRVMFRNVPSTTIEVFLGTNKKMENASFDIAQVVDGKIPLDRILQTFLESNPKLRHLQLGPHYIKSFFDRQQVKAKFEFKLSKLFLKFPLIRDESPDIGRNVSSFLANQLKLDWILFWELNDDVILTAAWNEIPALTHLTLIGLENLFDDSMNLEMEPNPRIVHLELLSRKILISQLRKLLSAAPNLKILHVHTLTKYIMEFTSKHHQMIQEMRFENIDEEVPDIYSQLKASSDDINKSIELKKVSFWRDASHPFLVDPTFWHT